MGDAHCRMKPGWQFWAMVLIVFLVIVGRMQSVDIPLERDEGEYAYAGQLILEGIPPWAKACNMKMPGIYYAYALMMGVAGQTPKAIHLALIAVNLTSVILLFFLEKRLFDSTAGVFAAATYGVLSMSPSVYGFTANAEHFVVTGVLAGLLMLFHATESNSRLALWGSGLLFGLAFTMKQHGAAFAVFAVGFAMAHPLQLGSSRAADMRLSLLLFIAGMGVPLAIISIYLYWYGVFTDFWFWTINYAWEYVNLVPRAYIPTVFMREATGVVRPSLMLWILAAIGMSALFWDKMSRNRRGLMVWLIVCSFASICPGFYFRNHYFILMLPAVSLCVGLALTVLPRVATEFLGVNRSTGFGITIVVFLIACFQPFFVQRAFFLEQDSSAAVRMVYGANPFSESVQIAEYVHNHTSPTDTIAVLGSEPQIYFYSKRKSATRYVYIYPLLENHHLAMRMQDEMMDEIESNFPKFLIFVHVYTSWRSTPKASALITQWFLDFTNAHYHLAGFVDMSLTGDPVFRWDGTRPSGWQDIPAWIMVFERNS